MSFLGTVWDFMFSCFTVLFRGFASIFDGTFLVLGVLFLAIDLFALFYKAKDSSKKDN